MQTIQVGEFKARFSEMIDLVPTGVASISFAEDFAITDEELLGA